MGRILFLESVAGIAGDMFAASFIDAGLVTVEELNALPDQLGLENVFIETSRIIKAKMRATHLKVKWHNKKWKQVFAGSDKHDHSPLDTHTPELDYQSKPAHPLEHQHGHKHSHLPQGAGKEEGENGEHDLLKTNILLGAETDTHWHTHYRDIDHLIENSKLELKVKTLAREIFRHIAVAEAEAHGMEVERVAFHEIGTVDSILDVVMASYCICQVAAERVFATPIKPGRGLIKMQHGTHPIPPPASARLLLGLPVSKTPEAITRENIELSTPTGIAILKTLAPQFVNELPEGVVRHQGMGAGTVDLGDYPNTFRLTLLEDTNETNSLPYEKDQVIEVVCNIDDDTSERIGWMSEQLLRRGALDVWLTPIYGKKGRPAISLSMLAEEANWMDLTDWVLRHSSTFGVRHRRWDRLKLVRKFEKRSAPFGDVTYKIGMTTSGEFIKEKAEFEELRQVWENKILDS